MRKPIYICYVEHEHHSEIYSFHLIKHYHSFKEAEREAQELVRTQGRPVHIMATEVVLIPKIEIQAVKV